jgi:nucleotide-binding universal stress UspA family protein
MGRIVVGVDESTAAAEAVRWAVRERHLRGGTLTAVLAWSFLGQHDGTSDDAFRPDYTEADAASALRAIIARAVADEAETIEQRVICDLPARALLEASEDADLLVVGARGLGGFRGMLLGSVSQQCAHHSKVPVAIVRESRPAEAGSSERIVVAADGSPTSQRALEWALDEARARHAALDVVHAWQPAIVPLVVPVTPVVDYPYLERDARRLVADQLARADLHGLVAPPEPLVVDDTPARAILDAAGSASLVVVGSRGRGGFAGLLLGSVSQHVVHHAPCPVVVIPSAEPA